MNSTVLIALFSWPLIALLLFAVLPQRRAVIANFVVGWLVLPVAGVEIPNFVDMTKTMSVSLGALLGVALFDSRRLSAFRPTLLDLPVSGLILAPFASSLSNGLGSYDGLSGSASILSLSGIPWLMGRLYGSDSLTIRDL